MCTHPDEADDDADRHEQDVADEEADHPDDGQPPRDELITPIGARQEVPILQLLRLEA